MDEWIKENRTGKKAPATRNMRTTNSNIEIKRQNKIKIVQYILKHMKSIGAKERGSAWL